MSVLTSKHLSYIKLYRLFSLLSLRLSRHSRKSVLAMMISLFVGCFSSCVESQSLTLNVRRGEVVFKKYAWFCKLNGAWTFSELRCSFRETLPAWPLSPTGYHKFSDNFVLLFHAPRKLRLLIDCMPLLREALPRTAQYILHDFNSFFSSLSISLLICTTETFLCISMLYFNLFKVSTFQNVDGLQLLRDLGWGRGVFWRSKPETLQRYFNTKKIMPWPWHPSELWHGPPMPRSTQITLPRVGSKKRCEICAISRPYLLSKSHRASIFR